MDTLSQHRGALMEGRKMADEFLRRRFGTKRADHRARREVVVSEADRDTIDRRDRSSVSTVDRETECKHGACGRCRTSSLTRRSISLPMIAFSKSKNGHRKLANGMLMPIRAFIDRVTATVERIRARSEQAASRFPALSRAQCKPDGRVAGSGCSPVTAGVAGSAGGRARSNAITSSRWTAAAPRMTLRTFKRFAAGAMSRSLRPKTGARTPNVSHGGPF